MKKYHLAFLFLMVSTILKGQTEIAHQMDSLRYQVEQIEDDSLKVKYLNDHAWDIKESSPTLAIQLIEYSSPIAIKGGFDYLLVDGIRITAIANRMLGDDAKAIRLNQEALSIYKKLSYTKGIMVINNSLGIIQKNQGKYEEALMHFNTALEYADTLDNTRAKAIFTSNRAGIFDKTKNYDAALKEYLKVLEYSKLLNDSVTMSSALLGLSINYYASQRYEQSLSYAEEALKIEKKLGDISSIGLATGKICFCLVDLGRLDSAYSHCNDYLEIAKQLGNVRQLSIAWGILGEYYKAREDKAKALECYLQSYELRKDSLIAYDPIEVSRILSSIVEFSIDLEKYQEAKPYAELALELAEKHKDYERLQYATYAMALITKAEGDLEAAYHYQEQTLNYADSFQKLVRDQTLLDLQTKYETELKEKELQNERLQSEKERERARRFIWIASLLGLLLLFIIYFLIRLRKKKEEIASKNKLLKEYQEKYIKPLKESIQVSNERGKREHLDLGEIVYMERGKTSEVGKNSLKIYTALGTSYVKKTSIKSILEELDETSFVRVDLQSIINLHFLKDCEPKSGRIEIETKKWSKINERLESEKKLFYLPERGKIREKFLQKWMEFQEKKAEV